jgi:hypothetical protein
VKVTHVGSGNPEEGDASLNLLDKLVCEFPEQMDPFYIFLKGMLVRSAFSAMDSAVLGLAALGCGCLYGARLRQEFALH